MKRTTVILLAAALAILAVAGVIALNRASAPAYVTVPVAVSDIPAGAVLRAPMFRAAQLADVDPATLERWITAGDWGLAEGKRLSSDVRAGFPLARAQIDPNAPSGIEARLSLAITGTREYYLVIPASPDQVGNFIQPGDRIDLIVSIGQITQRDLTAAFTVPVPAGIALPPPTPIPANLLATLRLTETLSVPATKLVVQNLRVIRVDHDTRQQPAAQPAAGAQRANPAFPDVKRLYVAVDRDQLEVLSFVLNNGARNVAVRGAGVADDGKPFPTDGVTWDDFVRWVFAQRGNKADGAQPFLKPNGR